MQLEGLRRLAYNLYWCWHPRARQIWSRIDRETWTRHRNPIPVLSGPVEWGRLLDDTTFMVEVRDVLREFDEYMENGVGRLVLAEPRRQARRARSPTSARSTASTSRSGSIRAAWACSRATTPRRRPTWPCRSSASACCTARATSTRRSTPTATRSTPTRTTTSRACRSAGSRRPTASRSGSRSSCRAATSRSRSGCAQVGPDAGPAARHRHPRERRRRPADHPHPLRPRPRDAAPPGAGARRRRRAGAAGARDRSRRSGT